MVRGLKYKKGKHGRKQKTVNVRDRKQKAAQIKQVKQRLQTKESVCQNRIELIKTVQ